MQLIYHFLSSIIAFFFLFPIIGVGSALVVAAASFFIDLDHLVWYWLNRGFTLNLKKMSRFFLASKRDYFMLPLHIPEIWILIIALSLIFEYPWIAIGFGLHIVIDLTADIRRFEKYSIIIRLIKKNRIYPI